MSQEAVRPVTPPDPHEPHSKHHDILFIRDEIEQRAGRRLERFPVNKITGHFVNQWGEHKPPVGLNDEGHRPTLNLGGAGAGTPHDPVRGPALSTLPLHPSPAASSASTCYLVNAQNLNYTTPWTAEEWNDRPGGFDAEGYSRPDVFSVLIASPAGKVYYLEKKKAGGNTIEYEDEHFLFREVDLRLESDVWAALRNGCVAGTAIYEAKAAATRREKVVPLVNIDSLTPRALAGESK